MNTVASAGHFTFKDDGAKIEQIHISKITLQSMLVLTCELPWKLKRLTFDEDANSDHRLELPFTTIAFSVGKII